MHLTTLTTLALAAAASAKTVNVAVGKSGFSFEPEEITADLNDTISFTFYPLDHAVAEGSFSDPCKPITNGFFSGFQPTSSGPANQTFEILVKTTDPIFFYCPQTGPSHCANGMVGVINGNDNESLAQYKAAAANVANPEAPSAPFGGQLVPAASGTAKPSGSAPNATSTSPSATHTGAASSLHGMVGVAAAAVGMTLAFLA